MAIYNLDAILNRYSNEYLILDFNHLFISSSIREEVWLLRRKPDIALVEEIMREAQEFGIYDTNEDKDVDTYSGGQKAILGCLLTLGVIRRQQIHGLKLLLNNVLDSLSDDNRSKLLTKFEEIQSTRHIRLFSSEKSHIQEIILKDGN